ncbi:MAG: TetR/AcrR family transcriptional regulator [Clostridiales bacterium]|nr:TetR/AcrR family transcriptional regulator [Clostridiales bacterium]
MKKQSKVTDATRESLVNAFFQLASKKNIDQITIREITDLAGYERTTFYRYFTDVFALVEYAENRLLQSTWEAIESQQSENTLAEKQFFEIIIQCFHENAGHVSVLLSERNRSHFLRRIKENVTNNLYTQNNDSPRKMVVRDIYFYGIFYAISVNLQSKDALPDDDLLDIIQKLFENWYWPEMKNQN